jgi:hypothetical protein
LVVVALRYNVAPRYTAGSPAQVDQQTADRVVIQERQGYQRALEGVYGTETQTEAEKLGLAWIVWTSTEVRSSLFKHDLLTNQITEQRIARTGQLAEPVTIQAPFA